MAPTHSRIIPANAKKSGSADEQAGRRTSGPTNELGRRARSGPTAEQADGGAGRGTSRARDVRADVRVHAQRMQRTLPTQEMSKDKIYKGKGVRMLIMFS